MRAFRIIFAIAATAFVSAANLSAADSLFADPVVIKGKGIEIRESDVDEAYVAYKAARAAIGQPMPHVAEPQIRKQVIDKLIATKLILARATPDDHEEGKKTADQLIRDGKSRSPSEASYRRQLVSVGTTPEKYEAEILEQAVVKAVIDRELKHKEVISEADIGKYYDSHPALFEEPEKARVAQILFATRKIPSGEPLPPKVQQDKKNLASQILQRARAGEDFGKLVREFSDDPESKNKGGELTFPKGGPVPKEFEAAAFSLKPGQVSDPVETIFGYHLIKLIEVTPAAKIPLPKVEKRIRDRLGEEAVQRHLPDFLEQLKKDAGVEIKGS